MIENGAAVRVGRDTVELCCYKGWEGHCWVVMFNVSVSVSDEDVHTFLN